MTPDAGARFAQDGFVVLPAHRSPGDLAPALRELAQLFPTADEFHDDVDAARNARFRDEFAGITAFPFDSTELSSLCVHPRLVELAEHLLGRDHGQFEVPSLAQFVSLPHRLFPRSRPPKTCRELLALPTMTLPR